MAVAKVDTFDKKNTYISYAQVHYDYYSLILGIGFYHIFH